jgi:hypothetical protein
MFLFSRDPIFKSTPYFSVKVVIAEKIDINISSHKVALKIAKLKRAPQLTMQYYRW